MGVAFNQSGEENHSICIDDLTLLVIGTIGRGPDIINSSILHPNGLVLNEFSGKDIEEGTVEENGIQGRPLSKNLLVLLKIVG
jgi:hypothetical protein